MALSTELPIISASSTRTEAAPEAAASAVSWPAIVAGAFVIAATSLILVELGAGIGFASISPWSGSGVSATTFTITAAVWLIVVQWLSSALGGYVTGRLRTKWTGLHTDEVMFRDTAHGLLAWAVASVIGALMLASAASSFIGGAANVAATSAGSVVASNSDPSTHFVDGLFRSTQPAPNDNSADSRAEATRIFALSLKNGSISPEDKKYLAQSIASRTGIPATEAEKRIDDGLSQAKAAADTARKNAAKISIYLCFSMLVGAFIAAVAGAIGGRSRDERKHA